MKRLALFALLCMVVPAQAAINGPQEFEASYPFMEGFDDGNLTVVSGELDVALDSAGGPFGFFNTTGMAITDLERVCWQSISPGCENGDVAIRVLDGGSAGVDFPGLVSGSYLADHALGLFIDFENGEDLNSFSMDQSLVAASVNGRMDFRTIAAVPFSGTFDFSLAGGFVALTESTVVEVLNGGNVAQTFSGKDIVFSFEGPAAIAPFTTDVAVLPFEELSEAAFEPAGDGAAAKGLDMTRLANVFSTIDGANQGAAGGDAQPAPVAEDFEDILAEVLNGALLRMPSDRDNFTESFAFVNFQELRVVATSSGLDWNGDATLIIQGDQVAGAPNLVGPKYFQVPWWSFLLWGVALSVWVARLIVKPTKEHPTWDRYKWAGWVFGVLAGLIVFILWDFEVRAVWGTSLLSTRAGGMALAVTALVQLAPLSLVLFAVAAPLRIMLRNTSLLARQGTFMGLSGGVAYLAGFVLGATLLLAYLEMVLVQVLESQGG